MDDEPDLMVAEMIARSAVEDAVGDAVGSESGVAASLGTSADGVQSSIAAESVAQRLVMGAAVVAAATANVPGPVSASSLPLSMEASLVEQRVPLAQLFSLRADPSPATTDVANQSDPSRSRPSSRRTTEPGAGPEAPTEAVPGRCASVLQEQWAPELPPGWESGPPAAAPQSHVAQMVVRGRESPDPDLQADSASTSEAFGTSPASQDGEASAPPVIAVLPPALHGPSAFGMGPPPGQRTAGQGLRPQPRRQKAGAADDSPSCRRTSARGRGGVGRAAEGPWPIMEYFAQGPLQLEPGVAISCDARIILSGKPFAGAARFSVRPELPQGIELDAATGRVSGKLREVAVASWSSRHEVSALVDLPGEGQCELKAKLVFMARPRAPPAAAPAAPPEASQPQLALTLAEPELQPWQLSKLWAAIAAGDLDTLRALVDKGTLRSDNVDSPKYVDDAGRTLLELARRAGHRMVLSFLYSLVRIGSPQAAALADGPPDGGPAARGPKLELDYPTLPHELILGRSCRHSVVVLNGAGAPQGVPLSSGPRAPLFSVCPPLPEGLVFEAQTGTIRGAPRAETWERIHVVSLSTVDSPRASERGGPVLEASCHIRIMVVAALQGLSYPRHECIVDPEGTLDADGQGGPGRSAATALPPLADTADAARPVSRSSPQGARGAAEFGRERTTKRFRLLPALEQGSADAFHAEPPLPVGMALDHLTGEIRGVPSFRATQAQKRMASEHTVVAQNTVGISSCRIRIEAHIGTWGMVLMKVGMLHCARRELEEASRGSPTTQRVQFATQDTPEGNAGRPWTAGNLLQVNWTQVCDMGRAVVDRSGTPVTIRGPLGAAPQAVKGMLASALVECLGLQKEPNSMSLLLQAVRCRESFAERRASPRLGASAPAGGGGRAPSLAAAEDLDGRPVVYVPEPGDALSRSAPGALQLRAASALSASPRGPPPEAAPPSSGAGALLPRARESTEGTRRQFELLLPLWREKLKEPGDKYGRPRKTRLADWKID